MSVNTQKRGPFFLGDFTMVNKVLAAFVGIDILFALTGALILGFSIIVQKTCFDDPVDGNEAARDLLYQQFPFSGERKKEKKSIGWAV